MPTIYTPKLIVLSFYLTLLTSGWKSFRLRYIHDFSVFVLNRKKQQKTTQMIKSNLTCGLCAWCQSKEKHFAKHRCHHESVCISMSTAHKQQLTKPSTLHAATLQPKCLHRVRTWQHMNINSKVFLSIFPWPLMVEFWKVCFDMASWFTHITGLPSNLLYIQPHTFLLCDVRLPSNRKHLTSLFWSYADVQGHKSWQVF